MTGNEENNASWWFELDESIEGLFCVALSTMLRKVNPFFGSAKFYWIVAAILPTNLAGA